MLQVIQCFEVYGKFLRGYNVSFITLVPKVNDLINLEQYRPISLVGAMYTIIFNLLANRIKQMLPKVIDKSQTTFLKG